MSNACRFRGPLAATGVFLVALLAAPCALADLFLTVDSTLDEPDDLTQVRTCHTATGKCTLRAAIMQANRALDPVYITLPAGTYKLTLSPSGDNNEADGDLDLILPILGSGGISIFGAGSATTIIDGNQIDRVFHIHYAQHAFFSNVTIRNGRAGSFRNGAGILNEGVLSLANVVIDANDLAFAGGGISNSGTLSLSAVRVSGNVARNVGGGINNYPGSLTMADTTIADNFADELTGSGGGIFTEGILFGNNSTVSGNTAVNGGGIYMGGGTLALTNATLSQNHATVHGGGLMSYLGEANLYNTTVAFNDADSDADLVGLGGGIYNNNAAGAVTNLRNALVAGNYLSQSPTYSECNGTVNSYGRNMFWSDGLTGCTLVSQGGGLSYALNSLATIGPLRYNGGPTKTHALRSDSNAIDNGDPNFGCIGPDTSVLTIDQRYFPRVVGLRCDLGAFEFNPASLDVDDNQQFDPMTDGLLILRYLFGMRGTALTAGALGQNALRTDPAAVAQYLDGIKPSLDVDKSGETDALTDGVMLVRYLSGLRYPVLSTGAVGANATRLGPDIDFYIYTLVPSSEPSPPQ